MKRLEIGDECYVREMSTKIIYKATWSRNLRVAIWWKYFRLVYPFPCIKELAQ